MISILLGILVVIVLLYVTYLLKEIQLINEQMDYILMNNTNAEITTSSKNKTIRNHMNKCNGLIRSNKEMKMQQQLNEIELHQILTSLTHDLRTPLTVASGYTQLLLENDAHNELAIKINKSLSTVNHYLSYLIDYNLIQEKKITVLNENINFSQFLIDQLFQYYEDFEKRSIQVKLDISPNIFIYNDKIILKRIVENILSNLLKYAKEHVHIVLKSEEYQLMFVCDNDYYGEIHDINLLLLRFQTLDESRQNKSMGIGLHIIQQLTEIVDGAFQVEATPDNFRTIIRLTEEKYKKNPL